MALYLRTHLFERISYILQGNSPVRGKLEPLKLRSIYRTIEVRYLNKLKYHTVGSCEVGALGVLV